MPYITIGKISLDKLLDVTNKLASNLRSFRVVSVSKAEGAIQAFCWVNDPDLAKLDDLMKDA